MRIFQETDGTSPISRLDPRVRLSSAFALALLTVVLRRWSALALAAAAALLLLALARGFNRATLRRHVELNLFSLFLLVFTPLSVPGAPWLSVGSLTWSREGVGFALRIAAKANIAMLFCGALISTMEPMTLARALWRLGVPEKLAHVMFFCIRYLEVAHVEYHRLRNAMRARGFRARCNLHSLRSLGYLLGVLFTRSIDRSERILEAMRCRGFDGRLHSLSEFRAHPRDAIFAAGVTLAGAAVAVLEWGRWTR